MDLQTKRILDLPSISSLGDNDLFIVEEVEEIETNSITYKDLLRNIINDLTSELDIHTMAFECSACYSLSDHQHVGDYTFLSVEQHLVGERYVFGDTIMMISAFNDNNECEVFDIKSPEVEIRDVNKPVIGTLKFVYHKNGDVIQTNQDLVDDEDFDGWLYPNGDTIHVEDPSRFSEFVRAFSGGQTGEEIVLPDFSGFFKPYPGKLSSVADVIPQHLEIGEHQHEIDKMEISVGLYNISHNLHNYVTNGTHSANDHFHNGGVSPTDDPVTITIPAYINTAINFGTISTDYEGQTGRFSPQHINVPVMIYVGGEIDPDLNFTQSVVIYFKIINGSMRGPDGRIGILHDVHYVEKNGILVKYSGTTMERVQSVEFPELDEIQGYKFVWDEIYYNQLNGKTGQQLADEYPQGVQITVSGRYVYDMGQDHPVDIDDGDELVDIDGIPLDMDDTVLFSVDDSYTTDKVEILSREVQEPTEMDYENRILFRF